MRELQDSVGVFSHFQSHASVHLESPIRTWHAIPRVNEGLTNLPRSIQSLMDISFHPIFISIKNRSESCPWKIECFLIEDFTLGIALTF